MMFIRLLKTYIISLLSCLAGVSVNASPTSQNVYVSTSLQVREYVVTVHLPIDVCKKLIFNLPC